MELFLSSFGGVAADGDGDDDVGDTDSDAYMFSCSLVRRCPLDDESDDGDVDVVVGLFGGYVSHLPAHRYHSAHRSPGHR